MKGFLICLAVFLCVVGTYGLPKLGSNRDPLRGRVGGGQIAENAPHACMVLVHRQSLNGTGTAALGGGTIISTRHCLTAAHLVQGNNIRYQIGFFTTPTTRVMRESTFALSHENYDNTDFSSDIALIFLQGSATFPLANAIAYSRDVSQPAVGDSATLVGFGFTTADSTGASADPYAASQSIATTCDLGTIEAAATHVCAIDTANATYVCPGDNGAGLFIPSDTEPNLLVGVASRILAGCNGAQQTGYTRVAEFADWIDNITGQSVATVIANYKKFKN